MDDFYSDGPDGATAEDRKPDEKNPKTATLPSDICPGMKPGEELVLKIERVLDGQYEVSYAPEKGGDEEYSEEPPMMRGEGDLSSMME